MEGAFRSGTVLVGKYRIDTLLGRDGMCLVFAGSHLQLSQPVVLKILAPESVTSLAVHARFLREAQSIARLTGEHVARIIDVGILPEGVPYSAMEALHGIDLGSELARRGALMPGEAVDYMLQACEALAEAHAHSIVHGELKPAHLFFAARPDGTMRVKVLGFELSRSLHARPGQAGSPGYMAPEQIKPTDEIDGRADVWALGIVLYQCITGRHPFQADSVSLMQQAAANESPRPMDAGIPRPLQAVVLRCLEKHRDARFPSIADLAAALAPFAHDQRAAAAIVDRASFMSHGLAGGYEVAPHGQYPIIAQPTAPAGYPSRSRRRYAMIGLGVLAVSLSGIAAAALIVPRRSAGTSDKPTSPATQPSLGPSIPAKPPAPPATTPAADQAASPAAVDSAAATATPGSAADKAAPQAAVDSAADKPAPQAAVDPAADKPAQPPAADAAPSTTAPAADRAAAKAADKSAAANASVPDSATGRSATDVTARSGASNADSPARSATSSASSDDASASVRQPSGERSERNTERAARPPATGSERAAAPASAPRGKRNDSCDSTDVDELMTRAAIQYDSGSATSALSFTRVALGCKQTDRMYWLAVMYACAAHDLANARLYFPKVPNNLQAGLETKCQRENLDVRSRKVD